MGPDLEKERAKQTGRSETGATAGKTHEQVLDEVVGPERRARNQAREGAGHGGET